MNRHTRNYSLFFVIVLLIVSCLSGCGKQDVISSADETTEHPRETTTETDCNRAFSNSTGYYSACETEEALYFFGVGRQNQYSYIMCYDKLSDQCFPLCGKADCRHNDSTCNAYINGKCFGLSAYNRKLYWLNRFSDGKSIYKICSCNFDGTDRREYELLGSVSLETVTSEHRVFFHRDSVYFYGSNNIVEEGKAYKDHYLFRCSVSGGETETVFAERLNGTVYIEPYTNHVYIAESGSDADGSGILTLKAYNIETGTIHDVGSYTAENAFLIYAMWADEKAVYLSVSGKEKIYRIDLATAVLDVPFILDEENKYCKNVNFGDDRIFTAKNDPSVFMIGALDFSGKTIMEQDYHFAFLQPGKMYSIFFVGSDLENAYIFFMDISKENISRFIAFPFDGSEARILWSNE
ncbi:MAG: hypothetical protein J5496_05855 [Lachnospiraceae bacterium]|nr:hypothetical protein [Lachnospiraceae bacterium]